MTESNGKSWYIGGDGLPQVWSWLKGYFWEVTTNPDLGDYKRISETQDA